MKVLPTTTQRPIFTTPIYLTYVHVNMSVGDFVVAVATTGGRRHGNRPTYHVTAGNEGSVFTIEPHTGIGCIWSNVCSFTVFRYLTVGCDILTVWCDIFTMGCDILTWGVTLWLWDVTFDYGVWHFHHRVWHFDRVMWHFHHGVWHFDLGCDIVTVGCDIWLWGVTFSP